MSDPVFKAPTETTTPELTDGVTNVDPNTPQDYELVPGVVLSCVTSKVTQKKTKSKIEVLLPILSTGAMETLRTHVNNDTVFFKVLSSTSWNNLWRNASLLATVTQTNDAGEAEAILDLEKLWNMVIQILSTEKINITQELDALNNALQPYMIEIASIHAIPDTDRTPAQKIRIVELSVNASGLFAKINELKVAQSKQAEKRAKDKQEKAQAEAAAKRAKTAAEAQAGQPVEQTASPE